MDKVDFVSMKTSVIAIIVVAIIAIAAVGVYFAFFNNQEKALPVDEIVRDNVIVGDDIELEMDAIITSSSVVEDVEASYMFYTLYYYAGEKIGTESIRYQGASITCDVYEYVNEFMGDSVMRYYVSPTSGVVFISETAMGGKLATRTVLGETNVDLTLTEEEQVVTIDTSIKYEGTMVGYFDGLVQMTLTGESLYTVKNLYTVETEEGTETHIDVQVDSNMVGNVDADLEVIAVDEDEVTIEGADEPMEIDQFLSMISYSRYIKVLEDEYDVTYGERTVSKMATIFGEREVTTQHITVPSENTELIFQFGNADVLYSLKCITTSGDNVTTTEYSVLGSSLISVKN